MFIYYTVNLIILKYKQGQVRGKVITSGYNLENTLNFHKYGSNLTPPQESQVFHGLMYNTLEIFLY